MKALKAIHGALIIQVVKVDVSFPHQGISVQRDWYAPRRPSPKADVSKTITQKIALIRRLPISRTGFSAHPASAGTLN